VVKKLNLNVIRIDGGTQSRVQIDNDVVAEYAEAIRGGAEFPPVIVFHDGADYWMADGFHRFHAHRHAERASISADVRDGTVREAILHSLGANGSHGLRRSNADKRKSVETMLRDKEWSQWSDSAIGKACAVDHKTVAAHRAAILGNSQDAPAVRTVERAGKTYQQDTSRIGKAAPAPSAPPPPAPSPAPAEPPPAITPAADEPEDFGPTAEEIAAQERAEQEEREALRRLIESDDKLATLEADNKQLRAMNRVLQSRVDGLMAEKAEAISHAKSWQRKADKFERALKKLEQAA